MECTPRQGWAMERGQAAWWTLAMSHEGEKMPLTITECTGSYDASA